MNRGRVQEWRGLAITNSTMQVLSSTECIAQFTRIVSMLEQVEFSGLRIMKSAKPEEVELADVMSWMVEFASSCREVLRPFTQTSQLRELAPKLRESL